MLMYTMSIDEMRRLKKEKLREMSEKLAHKVWGRDGYTNAMLITITILSFESIISLLLLQIY